MPAAFDHFGEVVIASAVAAVAWVMKTFTGQHIEAMEKLADKLDDVAGDVREMKVDIRGLKAHADKTDARIDRLEHPDA